MTTTPNPTPAGLRPDPTAPGEPEPLRRDGDLLLTGRAEFVDDIAPPGLLHAAILRSPHPHARIRSVDTSAAQAYRGVRLVLTGAQAAELTGVLPHFFDPVIVGFKTADFRCLATGTVRWAGEPVAAVVAETLADAEAACELIEVGYEVLPAVLDAERALEPDAPVLFPEWGGNLLGTFPFSEGDAEAAIAGAPHMLSEELRVGRHQSAPMEPRGYVASWAKDGRLTVWASTQNPHPLKTNIAKVLGISEDLVRVIAPRIGGGFGHKFNGYAEEPLVCLLSKLAGAPVKWLETREESLLVGAREFVHRFEAGYDDDGVVLGIRDRMIGNIGSLAPWGGWPMTFPAGMTFPGPYRVAHFAVESLAVVTNKAPWNGYRSYGKEQAALVLERIMDLVAQRLGLDPAEVRRRNFLPAEVLPHWSSAKRLDSGDYAAALDKALALAGYDELRERQARERRRGGQLGIGVAFELTPEGGDFAGSFVRGFDTSTVRIQPTGLVTVLTGVTSPGTGNETSIAVLVARELGVPIETVSVRQGDTETCPYGFGNFSSRSIATGGAAAVLAARELKERLAAAAAQLLGCDPGTVVFADGQVRGSEGSLPFAELADTLFRLGMARPELEMPLLEATKSANPGNYHHTPDEYGRFSTYPSYPYSAHIALVDLDIETGVVKLLEYSAVEDCGVIISPKLVRSQMLGAIAQGVGGALWEDQPYDAESGRPVARTLKHYLTPRAPDLPGIRLEHQQTPSPFTLLGTKGAGESGVAGAMAAVVNAVNDALAPLSVRAHRLPLSPPNVLAAIREGAER
jgi:aerobic carbon-monoxide dehydrogenase large subunit